MSKLENDPKKELFEIHRVVVLIQHICKEFHHLLSSGMVKTGNLCLPTRHQFLTCFFAQHENKPSFILKEVKDDKN